jgi:hypothetical protein
MDTSNFKLYSMESFTVVHNKERKPWLEPDLQLCMLMPIVYVFYIIYLY